MLPAGNDTSTCTGRAPDEPNDINLVETLVQFSTSPTLANAVNATGYRQTYSQVALHCSLVSVTLMFGLSLALLFQHLLGVMLIVCYSAGVYVVLVNGENLAGFHPAGLILINNFVCTWCTGLFACLGFCR